MTRKEFLQIIGGSLVMILGLGNVVQLFLKANQPASPPQQHGDAQHGFGSRKFGA